MIVFILHVYMLINEHLSKINKKKNKMLLAAIYSHTAILSISAYFLQIILFYMFIIGVLYVKFLLVINNNF